MSEVLYLCGPMRGLPDDNKMAFIKAALVLRMAGYEIVSPVELDEAEGFTSFEEAMERDLEALDGCDGVALLVGWERSEGAMTEVVFATDCGMPVKTVAVWLEAARQTNVRIFDTGATRDTEADKLDYEGFLSPLVLERYAYYMHHHRRQSDGTLRTSDNWQKGMPFDVYMKSMWRHFMDVWMAHRGEDCIDQENALCALLFNVQGYLHELLKEDS